MIVWPGETQHIGALSPYSATTVFKPVVTTERVHVALTTGLSRHLTGSWALGEGREIAVWHIDHAGCHLPSCHRCASKRAVGSMGGNTRFPPDLAGLGCWYKHAPKEKPLNPFYSFQIKDLSYRVSRIKHTHSTRQYLLQVILYQSFYCVPRRRIEIETNPG